MGLKWSQMERPIVALAPMDGITDSAYRRLVRGFHPHAVLFSEFTSAEGFLRSPKVRTRLDFYPEEQPYFVQLFGNNPQSFAEVAKALEAQGVAGIDINMGCPAKNIVSSQHGSALMKDPALACEIVEAVAKATELEVSVKTRLGWKEASQLVPFAKSLESAGMSMMTIHGRTYNQGFSGKADWEPIYELKNHLKIPLLGNGDIQNIADGMDKMKNLDGFMIGRAAIGNPWAFLNQVPQPLTMKERVAVICRHHALMRESMNPRHALLEFRKHLVGYLKGFENAKAARVALLTADSEEELMEMLGLWAEGVSPAETAPLLPSAARGLRPLDSRSL